MVPDAPKQNNETVHAVAEMLFEAAAAHNTNHVTDFQIQFDPESRTKTSEVIVPCSRLPEGLRAKTDKDVERQVIAFLGDFNIFVRVGDYGDRGRCFHVALPPELVGRSWGQIQDGGE